MNFNSIFLRTFRILLLPFALLYGLIIVCRNWLYNKKIFRSAEFNLPVICIGNLVLGGTGKSPMTEHLIQLLYKQFKVATVSRGYKRKTKGYALANEKTTALDIGDEPMQFHIKFPDVAVTVGEERVVAIPQLLHDKPETEVVLLDDAFQHRAIRACLNIVLTECNDLYSHDFFFPTGNLRDQRKSADRAQIIVVTKCKESLSIEDKENIEKDLALKTEQHLFFASIKYQIPYHILNHHQQRKIEKDDEILLVHGIANPAPLKNYISENTEGYEEIGYGDHHIFSIDDLNDINKKFNALKSNKKIILTTEKDAVRLLKFKEQLTEMPLYVLPVEHKFLFDEADKFNSIVIDFVTNFKKENIG